MEVCDVCKVRKAVPVVSVGQARSWSWCGQAACRKVIVDELDKMLEESEAQVQAMCFEKPKKE